MPISRLVFCSLTMLLVGNIFSQTLLDWPLKQSEGFNDPGYYYLSNYVDHDASSGILDYNGGSRTYNGHDGTDIVVWPFWWKKMEEGQVEVIAAADGVLMAKDDGHFDQSCAWTGGNSNFVLIEHSDGSTAYYAHLKLNSVTSKNIGQTISKGEYLGVVGSSGNSDKPHLHFEIRLSDGTLIDPFIGPDNNTTTISWWNNQPAYHDSGLNRIVTSSLTPEHVAANCPNTEMTNEKCTFGPGETIIFTRYYRHSVIGQLTDCKVYQPDGSIWDSWTHSHNATSQRRYSWNTRTLPSSPQNGIWTFEATFLGQIYVQHFNVSNTTVTCTCDYVINQASQNIYHAVNSIISNASLQSSDDLIYKAGNFIELNGEFEAPLGSEFEAIIEVCDY